MHIHITQNAIFDDTRYRKRRFISQGRADIVLWNIFHIIQTFKNGGEDFRRTSNNHTIIRETASNQALPSFKPLFLGSKTNDLSSLESHIKREKEHRVVNEKYAHSMIQKDGLLFFPTHLHG